MFPTAHALATGEQGDQKAVITWTNDYNGTRVFNTTMGHVNETVADPRYLDLVTRGLLWACGKLDEKGEIVAGYAPVKKAEENFRINLQQGVTGFPVTPFS